MEITVLGAESLGARGLCCRVAAGGRVILIDPGVALGPLRYGLPPHPAELAAADAIRQRIRDAVAGATDLVFSHYHGDHVPLAAPDPFQLPLAGFAPPPGVQLWYKGAGALSRRSRARRADLIAALGKASAEADGLRDGCITFSHAVPHGGRGGTVMMTRIEAGDTVFVHTSDMQLLDREAVATIAAWAPTIVLASGPPIYLPQLSMEERKTAWSHARFLASATGTLILDHHLLRSRAGPAWIDRLDARAAGRVVSAAAFSGVPPLLLEAERDRLYRDLPVPGGWHAAFARGEIPAGDPERYLERLRARRQAPPSPARSSTPRRRG